jgi:site-specific DNA-methyltransferase (adenine-specific)
MIETNYNPDVLSCLANLSNDEVFTPPHLANQILDLLPIEIWSNKDAKFLDPVCKSGVFLREIAKRLMIGLEIEIPDKQIRIDHIYKSQLYGIAITELTSLLSRRSVYCTKTANGKYSVCDSFDNEQGNIIYARIPHTWKNGKCEFCGANQEVYDREDALETYAYPFIHPDITKTIFKNMKFDVIVGNPPYQLSDGGAQQSASPIYHKFVQQAKKLNPKYLCMIVPARWYAGGKGLDEFRDEMLNDKRIKEIHDFHETSDVFPGLNIRGGVCYFLWDKDYNGDCSITNYNKGEVSKDKRQLLETEAKIFVRYNKAIGILKKVQQFKEKSFYQFVSTQKPFGLRTFVKGKEGAFNNSIKIYQNGGIGYIDKNAIVQNQHWINEFKLLVPRSSPGSDVYPHQVLGKPIVSEPNSACTETYVVVGPFKSKIICQNVRSYISTSFFRFLVILIKSTQDVPRRVYQFVPVQDFEEPWNDEKLYKKYCITNEEIVFIESMIRPMDLTQNTAVDE